MKMIELQDFADRAAALLDENREWEGRYSDYVVNIEAHQADLKELRKEFDKSKGINVYTTVGEAKEPEGKFSLRYQGQQIGELKIDGQGKRELSITKQMSGRNLRDFGFGDGEEISCDWASTTAQEFRKHFSSYIARSNKSGRGNKESKIEDMLLWELNKKSALNKLLTWIQPIKLSDSYFQFPTPLKASGAKSNNISYAKNGGGIDIFCRQGRGWGTSLLVVELKDEQTKAEPPHVVIKQAIAYAIFIVKLLRSDSGDKWYKQFEFNGKLPDELTIKVAVAMPSNGITPDFVGEEIKVGGDTLKLCYMPFEHNHNKITAIELLE